MPETETIPRHPMERARFKLMSHDLLRDFGNNSKPTVYALYIFPQIRTNTFNAISHPHSPATL